MNLHMYGVINGINWVEINPMKYWSFTASTPIEKRRETINAAIFGGEYIGALKVDGYYERLVKDEDGNCFLIARSRNVKGEVVNKIEWLPHINPWFESLPNGTCLLCECYLPGNEGSKNITSLLGCLKEKAIQRQKIMPLHLYVFDVMAFEGTNFNKTHYEERAKMVKYIGDHFKSDYVEYAEFYEGKELWEKISEYLGSGREGVVIMRKDAIVYDKRTPARVSIKIKKEIQQTIDCFFTGRATAPTMMYSGKEIETWPYWVDQITGKHVEGEYYKKYQDGASLVPVTKPYFYGWAGSLEIGVLKDSKVEPIGFLSGVTDDIKANFKEYAMMPIEVTCMEITQNASGGYGLRHAKMLGFRADLTIEDCSWEKVFN